MTRTHLLTLLLISTGSVLTGLCLMQERAEPQPSQEARAQAVETLPTNTTLSGNQVEQPEHTPIQVLNTPEQRHVATRNTCDVRCHSAGLLSQSVLAELCNLDTSLEQAQQSPLYHRLLIVLMLHPQAEAHMDDVAAEVRGNVDCADQAKWGTNAHIALLQRGVLDPLSTSPIGE
ncbi:TPA: hypothetical protein RUY97_002902 [Aeromonas dhakensis]|nr:hypothetical protein [Aeromonas dhakensis]HDX8486336.1 hypothetical protein [Aeromonas dhakensis]HDX8512966.1 hypothetical protein [Aeromonas dhakensis]HDZ8905616.1 hypothetical protein [Aeromonas dhakensis]HDZ9333091.1 hypothetical protein [Aeromonas dhakensis]